jgi:hypothetical protein
MLSMAKGDREPPTRSKPRETMWSRSRALSELRKGVGPDGRDQGCASQFDSTIDEEKKLIRNLRWNIPVLVQIVPNLRPSASMIRLLTRESISSMFTM